MSANLPPNAPPSGSAIDADAVERKVEGARELALRVTNAPCVLVETTSVPDGSSHAVQTCGSMYAW